MNIETVRLPLCRMSQILKISKNLMLLKMTLCDDCSFFYDRHEVILKNVNQKNIFILSNEIILKISGGVGFLILIFQCISLSLIATKNP
ncbi:MAG: hypothetical protein Phog2KO_31840 [Phototrophicaceae bacterium]